MKPPACRGFFRCRHRTRAARPSRPRCDTGPGTTSPHVIASTLRHPLSGPKRRTRARRARQGEGAPGEGSNGRARYSGEKGPPPASSAAEHVIARHGWVSPTGSEQPGGSIRRAGARSRQRPRRTGGVVVPAASKGGCGVPGGGDETTLTHVHRKGDTDFAVLCHRCGFLAPALRFGIDAAQAPTRRRSRQMTAMLCRYCATRS